MRLHGEYKEPGGKLIQVDFGIENERLAQVQISGDFFLYPEEALEAIVASVEGSPVALSADERASMVGASIEPGVEWLGASPNGLAIAIDRALNTQESA